MIRLYLLIFFIFTLQKNVISVCEPENCSIGCCNLFDQCAYHIDECSVQKATCNKNMCEHRCCKNNQCGNFTDCGGFVVVNRVMCIYVMLYVLFVLLIIFNHMKKIRKQLEVRKENSGNKNSNKKVITKSKSKVTPIISVTNP